MEFVKHILWCICLEREFHDREKDCSHFPRIPLFCCLAQQIFHMKKFLKNKNKEELHYFIETFTK